MESGKRHFSTTVSLPYHIIEKITVEGRKRGKSFSKIIQEFIEQKFDEFLKENPA